MTEEKRILVLSDSHRQLAFAEKALEIEKNIDEIWHLGDMASDMEILAAKRALPFSAVKGNCDSYHSPYNSIIERSIMGKRIFVTHGDEYGVKYSLLRLELAAQEADADCVLFGHTHIPQILFSGKMVLLNPGSIGSPRPGYRPSYGILKITKDGVYPDIKTL